MSVKVDVGDLSLRRKKGKLEGPEAGELQASVDRGEFISWIEINVRIILLSLYS